MNNTHKALHGVFVAAVTPIGEYNQPDLGALPGLLGFFANRGCHGALILGTTGEGPSFDQHERKAIFQVAMEVRQDYPGFQLLAGTGTPSLSETSDLTRSAFDIGFDGVVVLPPYYFRKVADEGLMQWYSQLLQTAVPTGGALLGYHIPGISGVPLSLDLIARLKDDFPGKFAGIKDSSGDPSLAQKLGAEFGEDLVVLNGNDPLLSHALESQASGCITALANVFSLIHRRVWDARLGDKSDKAAQDRLTAARQVLDRFQPAAPTLKVLLANKYDFPLWSVRPPLLNHQEVMAEEVIRSFEEVGLPA
jgi:4-hydroxy-tetrahydrodipicolinate synthase